MRTYVGLLLIISFVTVSCSQGIFSGKTDLERLAGMMTGSFSSQEQSIADSAFFDIRLEMKPIWTDRTDGHWFYVEQAVASYLDQPYRQRVYHLTELEDGSFSSAVFTMEAPERFAGAWKNENPLGTLTPDSLALRDGCSIILSKQDDGSYVGKTGDRSCGSSLRGASYATSEVTINKTEMVSWDRGWDDAGEQVWGAVTGGYIFKKID